MQARIARNPSIYRDLNKFNRDSRPLPSLTLPQNLVILSLEISADGQGGVIFIELLEGSFIVKPSMTVPNEMFYSQLGTQLGVRVPDMSYFTIEDSIHTRIWRSIQKYCQTEDECLLARLKPKFQCFFYALSEYIPSIPFSRIPTQGLYNLYNSTEACHQLGCCLGYDIIINNHDRFQLVWSGDGNLNNILVTKLQNKQGQEQLGSQVFIDNEGHMCNIGSETVSQNVGKYFQKILAFVEFVLAATRADSQINIAENPAIHKFVSSLQLYTGLTLSQQQVREVLLGIRDTIYKFISCHRKGAILKLLQQTMQISSQIEEPIVATQWVQQLSSIHINYCDLLYSGLCKLIQINN